MDKIRVQTKDLGSSGPRPESSAQVGGFAPLRLTLEAIGMSIDVQQPNVVVGRHSDAEVRLALPEISRRHCRIAFENDRWRVYDLSSLNGVFVNGERMQEATLYDGDRLQLGTFSMVVELSARTGALRGECTHSRCAKHRRGDPRSKTRKLR